MTRYGMWGGIALVLAAAFTTAAASAGTLLFEPAELASLDGNAWSGITFGQTTAQDLQRMFRLGKCKEWQHSTRLLRPKEDSTRYLALFSGKGKLATVSSIVAVYDGATLTSSSLSQGMGLQPTRLWLAKRYENWHLELYQDKGALAFVFGDGDTASVAWLLLTRSAAAAQAVSALSREATAVEVIVDPYAGKPRVAEFGNVSANFNLKNVAMKDGEKERLENSLRQATAGGAMRYRAGAPGSLTANVSIAWDRGRGGSVSVTCTLAGECCAGSVRAEGSSFQILPKNDMAICENASLWYSIAIAEAMSKLSDSVKTQVPQAPPSAAEMRAPQWNRVVEDARHAVIQLPAPQPNQ
ncbi:MAG: hypothetical protein ABFE08_17100 [Armatimonadia bacterium]